MKLGCFRATLIAAPGLLFSFFIAQPTNAVDAPLPQATAVYGVIATDPVVHPKLDALFSGALGARLDSLLASLGMSPQFAHGGGGGEVVLGILGVLVVLVAGWIWRRRALQNAERAAKAA